MPLTPSGNARLILLGASNLTRGFSTVCETSRMLFGSPLEILAALGYGRAYGMGSSILGVRSLPSILDCGIWDAIAESKHRRPQAATLALLTDIGNDIAYGGRPDQIVRWLDECIDRLRRTDATIAMTELPIESIRSISRWQYAIVKPILYPMHELTYEDALQRAAQLHERMKELAQRRKIHLAPQRRSWFGFDPIHVRFRYWPAAWAEILAGLSANPAATVCARSSLLRWARVRTLTPQRWRLFGIERGRAQPAGRLPDGTTISLF